jgi:hypothetical protein
MNLNYDVGKPYLFIEVVKQPQTPYVWVGNNRCIFIVTIPIRTR